MKFQTFLISLLFTLNVAFAQQNTIFSGKITNPTSKYIQIDLVDARQNNINLSDSLNENNEFKFEFTLEAPAKGKFSDSREYTSIYMEPGDNVNLTLNTDQFDETVNYTGKGSENNNYLARNFLLFTDPDRKSRKPEDVIYTLKPDAYVAFVDSFIQAKQKFHDLFVKDNKLSADFTQFLAESKKYEDASLKMQYATYNTAIKDTTVEYRNSFMAFAKDVPLSLNNQLVNDAYQQYIQLYLPFEFRNRYDLTNMTETQINRNLCTFLKEVLPTDLAYSYIGSILANALQGGSDVSELADVFDDFYANCKNQELVDDLKRLREEGKRLSIGQPAPDFELLNVKGKKVKLSDFKGKVVFIDFWASWCRPCMEEVPAAKALKEKYDNNKNIEFLYISVDQSENDWKEAMKNNKMKGNHLRDDGTVNVGTMYNIQYIPFFIIIDKNGNIAKNPAKRPSEEGVEDEINEVLNKN